MPGPGAASAANSGNVVRDPPLFTAFVTSGFRKCCSRSSGSHVGTFSFSDLSLPLGREPLWDLPGRTFAAIYRVLGCFWLLLATSPCFWLLLAALGSFWLLLAPPGCSWLLLAAFGCSCLCLPGPGCSWLLLVAYGPFWLFLARLSGQIAPSRRKPPKTQGFAAEIADTPVPFLRKSGRICFPL